MDDKGNTLSETIYDTEGRVIQTVDALGCVSENVYNSLMQIEKVRTGQKGTLSGGLYTLTGEVRETAYTYDDLGRTTKVTDSESGVSSVVFDSLGRITSLKDPNQNDSENKNSVNTYTYLYNEQGLLEQETNAVGNTTSYQYNENLLLASMKDSENETTKYTYDSLNRLKTVSDELGTISYTYDKNGNITEVSEKEKGLFGVTKTIRREFDSLNRITKYTDYKGREVKYAYDIVNAGMEGRINFNKPFNLSAYEYAIENNSKLSKYHKRKKESYLDESNSEEAGQQGGIQENKILKLSNSFNESDIDGLLEQSELMTAIKQRGLLL